MALFQASQVFLFVVEELVHGLSSHLIHLRFGRGVDTTARLGAYSAHRLLILMRNKLFHGAIVCAYSLHLSGVLLLSHGPL